METIIATTSRLCDHREGFQILSSIVRPGSAVRSQRCVCPLCGTFQRALFIQPRPNPRPRFFKSGVRYA